MRRKPAPSTRALATLLFALAALPASLPAQSYVPQPQLYMLSVDAADARALWLQPAGLARRREASLGAFAGAERDGRGGLANFGVLLGSNGLGIGWQRDLRDGGRRIDNFTVGFSAGHARAGVGASRSWYGGGGTKDGAYSLGGRYQPRPAIDLSLVWRDISSPVLLGDTTHATLLPAAALNLFSGRARLVAEWEIVTRDWGTSALRAGANVSIVNGVVLALRTDFDGSGERRSFAVSLSWTRSTSRFTGFATDVRAGGSPYGGYGALIRPLVTERLRPTRI